MLDGLTSMENRSNSGLIKEKRLPNGMRLSFFDESKIMAGDRWLVKLRCQARLPLSDDDLAALPQDDPELLAYMREKFAGNLSFTTVRERIFVDEKEHADVLADLLATIEAGTLDYLASPAFPEKLLASSFEEIAREFKVKKELGMLEEEDEDDDGPADFSACFND